MLLVIFGAGASYDSVTHLPCPPNPGDPIENRPYRGRDDRPPLANQLFEDRTEFVTAMDQFKDCMALIPSLRTKGIAVEQELARIQQQAETFPQVHRELAAIRYYLHVALWQCEDRWYGHHRGITNYATLLREIERWRFESKKQICFVTFNYDTMIEQAMRQVLRLEIRDLDSYISHDDYALIKLHGSVNWGREVDGLDPNNLTCQRLIDGAGALQISKRYRRVSRHPMWLEGDKIVVFPALAIPVDKKDEFSCPDTHVKFLEGLLPKVTKIIAIGWRATEAEFLSMLASKLKGSVDLMVVSGDKAGAEELSPI